MDRSLLLSRFAILLHLLRELFFPHPDGVLNLLVRLDLAVELLGQVDDIPRLDDTLPSPDDAPDALSIPSSGCGLIVAGREIFLPCQRGS